MNSDLKLNRNLLDLKFEGYKISLDPIPVTKRVIEDNIKSFELEENEYGYNQVRMSALFNQLFQDLWSPTSVFFVTQQHHVYWSRLLQDGHLSEPRIVWKLPIEDANKKYNVTIAFPGADWACVTNGKGSLFLLYTPSRAAGEPWTVCHTYSTPDCHSLRFLIHGVHRILPGRQQIDCLVAYFSRSPNIEEDQKTTSLRCMLEWLSFACGENIRNWITKRIRRLEGSSTSLEYAALEVCCDAVCIVSEDEMRMVFDSEMPCENENGKEDRKEEINDEPPLYTYMQTAEDITVVFKLPEEIKKSDIQVQFQPSSLEVLLYGKCVLRGKLSNVIETSSCTWTLNDQRLEIVVSKNEVGLMWQELIKGDKSGKEIIDPALAEEIHSKLAHLTSETEVVPTDRPKFNLDQLEECDSCTNTLTLFRIDGNTHKETHRINLSGHQWLFSYQICPESLPVICLRHDVDGIVWQPHITSSEEESINFIMEHISTFNALGYVQASKQNKKFILCSPDFSFSVISDISRHIYIYCEPEHLNSQLHLRNRKTGESVSHIAKQYVINLEHCDKVLGARVCKECIFILSADMLYAINISRK